MKIFFALLFLVLVAISTALAAAGRPTNALGRTQSSPVKPAPTRATRIRDAAQALTATLERLVQEHAVVGAQLALGDDTGLQLRQNFGVRSPGSRAAVDADTLFCLGSCSKPIAAMSIMALSEKSRLNLDQPINRWLPAFGHLELADGRPAARAPTVRELLAHRAGIYSQKERMTANQNRWIRDFTLTLAQAVDGIAGEPLVAQPGERFAYSGAGYCVLGRVAEVATGQNLQTLLYDVLGRPLDWRRTTYFPSPSDFNIATGGARNNSGPPDPRIPHAYGSNLRLPLVGGGLYSTATETAEFARMMLRRGRGPHSAVLSEATWTSLLRPPFPGRDYGLGWFLALSEDRTAWALRHTGAFASARSQLDVLLDRKLFVVIHYTIASTSAELGSAAIAEAVRETLTRLTGSVD
jgi:CubicO group peptidase (beta-lactamase class C family)